jgi:hypothetical protein
MMIVTFCQLVCPLNEYNNGRLCSCQGQLVLLSPMIFFWNQSSCICCDGLSMTLTCLVLIFGILQLPEVYCLVCLQRQHVHVTTVVAYTFSFLLLLSSLDGQSDDRVIIGGRTESATARRWLKFLTHAGQSSFRIK